MSGSTEGVLSVMMPIYNEERTLAVILRHVLARPEVGEIIAVDDRSTDRSSEILAQVAAGDRRLRPLRQERNLGKGAALRLAIGEVTLPYALVQDADLEYDSRDYAALLDRWSKVAPTSSSAPAGSPPTPPTATGSWSATGSYRSPPTFSPTSLSASSGSGTGSTRCRFVTTPGVERPARS